MHGASQVLHPGERGEEPGSSKQVRNCWHRPSPETRGFVKPKRAGPSPRAWIHRSRDRVKTIAALGGSPAGRLAAPGTERNEPLVRPRTGPGRAPPKRLGLQPAWPLHSWTCGGHRRALAGSWGAPGKSERLDPGRGLRDGSRSSAGLVKHLRAGFGRRARIQRFGRTAPFRAYRDPGSLSPSPEEFKRGS